MTIDVPLNTSVSKMSGGVAAVAGVGERNVLTVGGTWVIGDTITLLFTDTLSGDQIQVGAGDVTGVPVTFCFTYHDKEYLLGGSTVYFSAVGRPTVFNDPFAQTNGFVLLTNHYATPDDLVAIASY